MFSEWKGLFRLFTVLDVEMRCSDPLSGLTVWRPQLLGRQVASSVVSLFWVVSDENSLDTATPLPGQLHPMTEWWRSREAWLSHSVGKVLKGQSIFSPSSEFPRASAEMSTEAVLRPNFPLCPILLSSLPFHKCWIPKALPKNTLHTSPWLRVGFLGQLKPQHLWNYVSVMLCSKYEEIWGLTG